MNKQLLYVALVCLLVNCLRTEAQVRNTKQKVSVYLNKETSSLKATLAEGNATPEPKEDLEYYWYASNKIMHTQGGYDGKLLDGNYSAFYLSNNLKEKGSFKKGLKHGKWVVWHENGKMQEVSNWRRGRKIATYKVYNKYGDITLKASFRRGRLHGKMITYDAKKVIDEKRYKRGEQVDKSKPLKVKKLRKLKLRKPEKNKVNEREEVESKRRLKFLHRLRRKKKQATPDSKQIEPVRSKSKTT